MPKQIKTITNSHNSTKKHLSHSNEDFVSCRLRDGDQGRPNPVCFRGASAIPGCLGLFGTLKCLEISVLHDVAGVLTNSSLKGTCPLGAATTCVNGRSLLQLPAPDTHHVRAPTEYRNTASRSPNTPAAVTSAPAPGPLITRGVCAE